MGFQETFNERVIPAAERAFGITVTLTQGPKTTAEFTALWREQTYNVADAEGFMTSFQVRDFEFAKSDVSALAYDPRSGDRIAFTENEVAVEYELAPVGSLPAAQLMAGGYRWLVHTKRAT